MPTLSKDNLDEMIVDIQAFGGDFNHPEVVQKYRGTRYVYHTAVDESLSPYSSEYFAQQMRLYQEISGRTLDQHKGELHPVDYDALINAANPMGITDTENISEHVRSVSTMLSLASLKGEADVLDMGAGHGIASEVLAFSGCKVLAVDIDPALGRLSQDRAAARSLDIDRVTLNFDDLSQIPESKFAAAFFSQSLHHCLRPWELIANLKCKLKTDGIIGFVGEPIQDLWWKHWGIRLDEMSLYVARAQGWFESGWSFEFICDCFKRNGMELSLFTGGFHGGEIGFATQSQDKHSKILEKAVMIGIQMTRSTLAEAERSSNLANRANMFSTIVGKKTQLHGRPAFTRHLHEDGPLVYGPYIQIAPGTYEFSSIVKLDAESARDLDNARLLLDVVIDVGKMSLFEEVFDAEILRGIAGSNQMEDSKMSYGPCLIIRRFEVREHAHKLELRAIVFGPGHWTVALPVLHQILPFKASD